MNAESEIIELDVGQPFWDRCFMVAPLVLVGTRDERNFHLRALAAIAQTAQAKDFERRWLSARNPQALRDIMLLSTRARNDTADGT